MAKGANRVGKIAADTARVREKIINHPGIQLDSMIEQLGLPRSTVLSVLDGLADDQEVCQHGKYRVKVGRNTLTVQGLREMMQSMQGSRTGIPGQAERLIYLYNHLHNALPDGGLTMKQLKYYYEDLFVRSESEITSQSALERMIYRDLRALDEMGIVIERSTGGNLPPKYRLRMAYLPKLVPENATAVYIGLMLFKGTVLNEPVNQAQQQLRKAFFNRPVSEIERLSQRFHIINDTLAHPENFGDKFGKLTQAVIESCRLRIEYTKISGETSTRVIEPLGMICKRNVWYLVAREPQNGEYRTFRVDQISDVCIRTGDKFKYPEDFSLHEYYGESWGVFRNDEVQKVRLKFSPDVARRVTNLRYHESQRVEAEEPDGSVILSFTVCGLIELTTWVLQWGKEVEVLEPENLRERVLAMAREVIEIYDRR